jgi:hypothetical protein
MIFARIEPVGYHAYIQPLDQLVNFAEEIKLLADEGGLDEYKWTVTLVEMTQEAFDALLEFDGY